MSDKTSSEDTQVRFKELANGYQPKLPLKLAQMLPFKKEIQELRARKAAYDDIRLLLQDANITVSLDTVYRFCRNVIGEKSDRLYKARAPKHSPSKVLPVQPSPESIQTTLREQRERFPGPWSRRKRGPRISHNARYLVVKNEALSERFANYERSATRTRLMEELAAKEITMPKLYDWIVADLNRHDLTVSAGIKNSAFDFFNRQRLQNWQHQFYDQLESVRGMLLPQPPTVWPKRSPMTGTAMRPPWLRQRVRIRINGMRPTALYPSPAQPIKVC
jgi:hypothetical protein